VNRSPELIERAEDLLRSLPGPLAAHCRRSAAVAVEMAERFGVDRADAELAALLHDFARDVPEADSVRLADELGVPMTAFETAHPMLLHARIGAAMVRRELPGVGEAVLSAISAHTVGAVPMSDLDRIVYIADAIEPGRDYPGVDEVRAACSASPLAECFRLVYGRSMRHVLERGRPLHPISAAVGASIERETGRALFDPAAVA